MSLSLSLQLRFELESEVVFLNGAELASDTGILGSGVVAAGGRGGRARGGLDG